MEAVSHGIFNCRVPYSGKKPGSIETNVAIETVDSKYGLVWTELYCPDFRCRLLDYRYDNMYFINDDNNLLVACQSGKVGLYTLEVQNDSSETVTIRELLPCRYKRIERSGLNCGVLLVYDTGSVMWFNIETRVLSRGYDDVKELTRRYLLLSWRGRSILLDIQHSKIVCSLPEDCGLTYECGYCYGQVFRIVHMPCETSLSYYEQLLFVDDDDNVKLSPMADSIDLTIQSSQCGSVLTKVSILWGRFDVAMTEDTVEQITGITNPEAIC